MDISSLLSRPMQCATDHLYVPNGNKVSLKNWDALAAENPINAAISQDDDRGEIKKGAVEYAAFLREFPRGIVLDLGCGYGRMAKYVLPERAYDGYIGLDNSTTMLQVFEQRYASRPEERRTPLMLLQAGIDEIPLKDASVDAVVTSAVWLHNPKPVVRKSIREILRVLKPGGKLLAVGSFPNGSNPASWQEMLNSHVLLPLRGRQNANGPVRTYTPAEVRALFSSFKDVRLIPFGCRVVPIHLLILHRMLNLWTWKQLARPLNRLAERVLHGRMAMRFATNIDVVATK